jgi:hypothetical protein
MSTARRAVIFAWALLAVDLVVIVVTYARIPPEQLYNVSGSGLRGGLGRALVELNFPGALIGLAVLAVLAPGLSRPLRLAGLVAAALCLVVVVPGVVSPKDLDAKLVNVVPALGVVLAFAVSIVAAAPGAGRPRGDRLRIVLLTVAVLAAAPWIAATLGFYLDGVPVLGWIFQTGEIVSYRGNAPHPAVHHGIHHGWQGLMLISVALALSRLRLTRVAAAYLSLMLAYGIGNLVNDDWLEQIAERGWTNGTFPDVLQPRANWGWLLVLAGAAAVWALWFRGSARAAPDDGGLALGDDGLARDGA